MRGNSPEDVFKKINMAGGDITQCWLWKGKVNKKDNRPYMTIKGKRRPAYVISLELFSGEVQAGRLACHSCDTPRCCNPHHLKWASHQDNMDDMVERERHGIPKTVVRAIRRLRIEGKTQQHIADLYGVSRETISAIDTERTKK